MLLNSAFLLLMIFTFCASSEVFYKYGSETELVRKSNLSRIQGFRDRAGKDVVLGGLFTIHFDEGGTDSNICGSKIWEDGMDMMEAMLHAIDSVNSDPNLLPNLTLGYDIRDTCKRENIALDETIDLIFSSGILDLESCSELSTKGETPVSVIIGAFESFITIPVAGLLRLIRMPQISYGSSSTTLSNRELYSYFYRTFPSDDQQARAMIDLIKGFGWDHISTINSNNLYGQRGIEEVKKQAKVNNICIDLDEIITDEFKTSNYTKLAEELMNTTSKVVVLFASVHHVRSFLTQLNHVQISRNQRRQFIWIASDTWAELTDSEFNNVTTGKYGFAAFSENFNSFDNYYSQLSPSNNKRDPWFTEFYEQYYSCKINTTCANNSVTEKDNYKQFSVVPLVTDAIYSVAHAIQSFIDDKCNKPLVWYEKNQSCEGNQGSHTLSGQELLAYIGKVNFTGPTMNRVKFDENGNVPAKYSIFNYQVMTSCIGCSNTYRLVNVGYWDGNVPNDHLVFYPNVTPQFGVDENDNVLFQLQSQCQQCSPGFIKQSVISSCCGTCRPCLGQNYTNSTTSSTQCDMCPQYMWGNSPLNGSTECIDIQESYLMPQDPWAIVLMILAIIGLLSVVFVSSVFIWFWNTPIVKSSGREQMTLIMIGITLCFLVTVVFILKPSVAVCALQRIGTWLCFSVVLSAILVKLIRITRIFLRQKISGRPKFISPPFQILFTFLFVGFHMVLVLISLVVVFPDTNRVIVNDDSDNNNVPQLILQCTSPHIATVLLQITYYTLLVVAGNGLAILTIRFPQNFNESKYIAFSTFSLGVIWIAFILAYFAISNFNDTTLLPAIISLTVQLSAFSVLVCLFGPRVFIMIVWPSQNVLTTTTAVATTKVNVTTLQLKRNSSDQTVNNQNNSEES